MIRKANKTDLDEIMSIIEEIQQTMKAENNPQWNAEDDYPNRNKFLDDIKNESLYVYDEGVIKGLIAITKDNGDYDTFLKTTSKPAYILHRLAIRREFRKEGLAIILMNYAEYLAKENKIELLKADTEIRNIKMNNLFLKLGFTKKGEFEYSDYPGHYIYYEKELNKRDDKNV